MESWGDSLASSRRTMARAESGRVWATRRAVTRTVSVWADGEAGDLPSGARPPARASVRLSRRLPHPHAPRQHQLLQDAGFVGQRARLESTIGVQGQSQGAAQLGPGPELRPAGPPESRLLPAPQAVRSRGPEVRQQRTLQAIAPPGVAIELRPGERRADEGGAQRAEHADAAHTCLLEH